MTLDKGAKGVVVSPLLYHEYVCWCGQGGHVVCTFLGPSFINFLSLWDKGSGGHLVT